MEKMNDLKDLLTHEIQDLYSAEEQIIAAMPLMIEKAKNAGLKKALTQHLRITEEQKNRLNIVKNLLKGSSAELPGGQEENRGGGEEKKGFLSGLFGGSGGSQVCRGMMGLIEEGQKIMKEDMNPEVLDAAIIASSQKIEHYEICGYGTARAFAIELNLNEVAELLEQTLEEEYTADDLLTDLAEGGLNEVAEGRRRRRSRSQGNAKDGSRSITSRGNKGSGNRSKADKKAAPKKAVARKSAPAKKGAAKKAAPRKAAPKKAVKKAAPKKATAKGGRNASGRGSNKSKGASARSSKSGSRAGNSIRGQKRR